MEAKSLREIELEKELEKARKVIESQNKVIESQDNLIKERDGMVFSLTKENEKLKKSLARANRDLDKASLEIKRKDEIIKLNNYNKYFSMSEKTKNVLKKAKNVKSLEKSSQGKRGRKKGKINHEELDNVNPDETITLTPEEIKEAIANNECIIIGKDVAYKIVKNPATYKLIKIVRPKYLYKNKIYQTLSNEVFGKSIITPSFVSNAIYLKYCLCMPINKLSKFIRNQFGIIISNQSWCDYFKKAVDILKPIEDEIEKELVHNTAKIMHLDETTATVSKSKMYPDKSKFYFLCGCTTYYDHNIRYYKYLGPRKIDENIDILSNYEGVVVCDAYPGYNNLTKIKLQCCWVHARRYIADSIKIREVKNDSPQVELLEEINKLFEIEEKIADLELCDIKKIRDQESVLVLNNIKTMCLKNENTKIDKFKEGINYILNHWDSLCLFLTDPCIPIHNNQAERTVGYFVQARKNFQTMASDESAKINASLFTIVMTAQANGLDVEKYLNYVLNELHKGTEATELLPWSENLSKDLLLEGLSKN